ncbi:MAG: TetR family transcriptional regulator C-terminal domain-containing protein, partial [Actinobacteria bacterium]|nr:TetR family transcriptional regulator C-terminal domain-containing protein [Actinomycetota bacterium]
DSVACRQAMSDAVLDLRNRFRNALLLAQEQGTVRDDISAAELADLLLNAWEGSIICMKIDRSVKPLKQFIKLIVDDYLRP